MKLLILLTSCVGFVVCVPRDRIMIIVPAESGPTPKPKIYQSGPVVPKEAPDKVKADQRSSPFQIISNRNTLYGLHGQIPNI